MNIHEGKGYVPGGCGCCMFLGSDSVVVSSLCVVAPIVYRGD